MVRRRPYPGRSQAIADRPTRRCPARRHRQRHALRPHHRAGLGTGARRRRIQSARDSRGMAGPQDQRPGPQQRARRRSLRARRRRAAHGRASGRITQPRTAPQADLRGEWRHAQWPLRGAATVTSASGSFALAGWLADFRVQLQGEVGGDKLPHASVTLTGNGTQQTFTLSAMTAQLLGGRLDAHGELRWQPQLDGTLVWQADGIDPGVLWPAWPGALHVSGSARAAVRAGVTTAHVELPDIRGELRGHAFDGRSRQAIDGERIELSHFEVHANCNRVCAAGSLSREWDLVWTVVASVLVALIPDVGGALRA